MQATLLGISQHVREQFEQGLEAQGLLEGCPRLYAQTPRELPRQLSEGLLVLEDTGRSLEETLQLCQELHSRRNVLRTHLVVLTRRPPSETGALIHAGADECAPPPGGDWLARLTALARRTVALGLVGAQPSEEVLSSERIPLRQAVQALLDSTLADLGHHFFRNLVRHLSRTFGASCVLVGELLPERDAVRTLAFWLGDAIQPNVTYELSGTPCDEAIRGSVCHIPTGVAERFPRDQMLADLGMRGYLGAPLKDGNGNAIGILALLHNQPLEAGPLELALLGAFAARAGSELERIQFQDRLERTRDFLRKTLDAVPDPLFVTDRAHRWVAVNRAFCRFLGRDEGLLLGSSCRDFLPAQEAEALWRHDEQVFTSGEPSETEENLTDHSGLVRTLVTQKAVFTDPAGDSFLITTIRDITERRNLEMQLRLADRMVSIGTLAAGVAHEVNNPLAYVCSNLSFMEQLLTQPQVPAEELPELREVLAETQEGIRRVRTIVQDLKTFARSDEGRLGPVDVHQTIDGALRLVRRELQYRAELECALEPVPAVHGNEGRLGQVLVNLLVNALQAFTGNEPGRNRVRVRTRLQGAGQVVVEVEDNGPGMSPEVRQRIFDPFFTTKPAGVGTGLGLSICQSIMQSMQGLIQVESELGRGSLFRLVLPVSTAVVVPRASTVQLPLTPQRMPRRLLLIDTEPAVGTSVRRVLSEVQEVHAVQDVQSALQLLARGERYDAILCDMVLPGMSGVDFLQELERREPGLSRRTGFMSSGTFSPPARELMAARDGELLEKPFEPERLRRFVQRLLA
jgi:PAS domain S-box-containing protein